MNSIANVLRGQVAGTAGWSAAAVAISAGTGIITARTLGPEGRGTLALVLSIAGLCVLVGSFGTNLSIRRHLPRRQRVTRRSYYRVSLLLVLPLTVILLGVVAFAAPIADPAFTQLPILIAFVGYGFSLYFSTQALDLLNAVGSVRASSMINALGSLACLLLVAACALMGLGLPFIAWSYSISVLLQVVGAIAFVGGRGKSERAGPGGVRLLLADGGRLLGLTLGQNLASRSDTVLLGVLSSQIQVGIYAVAITPATILRIPANALGQVLFHQSAAAMVGSREVLRKMAVVMLGLVPIALVGWFAAGWLIPLIFGPDFAGAVWPFRLLLIAEILLSPVLVLGKVLAGSRSPWSASASGMIGVIVLVVGCFIWIPEFGAIGAALASVAAYASMSALAVSLYLGGRAGRCNDQPVLGKGSTLPN